MSPDIAALDRLKAQLLTSGIQERNQPLYQVINQLIDYLRQTVDFISEEIAALTPSTTVSGGTITTTTIMGGGVLAFDGADGIEGPIGISGPRGPIGPIGIQGPPGFDGDCEDCSCMPFIANSKNGASYTQIL